MDITGIIEHIGPTEQVSDRYRKRIVVIETRKEPGDQYPQLIQIELGQDKCSLLDGMAVGQEVQIWFDLRGRKWTDRNGEVRYFTTLQGWRVQAAGAGQRPTGNPRDSAPAIPIPPEQWEEPQDEIPF